MIKHLVAGGCSFTADGIGGVPPSPFNPDGACTFIEDESYVTAQPQTWVSFLSQQLPVKSLVNLAADGHGNVLTANNIISLLTRFKYDPTNTLVMFNITDASRLDLMCDWLNPDASLWCTWPENILNFKYLDPSSTLVQSVKKHMGLEQVETCSANALWGLVGFLKANGFDFRFMTMRDYTACYPAGHPITQLLEQYQAHWIQLGQGRGMLEYVQQLNLTVSSRNFHPTVEGHRKIAQCVLQGF